MPYVGDERTGSRIATQRKLRGLTQRGLAMKANVAYSTLTKIESGHSMAQPAIVAAIARALSVNVTQLTGQPYMNELREAKLDEFVEQLRIALDSYDLVVSEDVKPRSVTEVSADVMRRCHDVRDGRLGQAAGVLPGLLGELAVSVAEDPSNRVAWRALFLGYDCVRFIASSWGFRDLAITALDRMAWASSHADDPLSESVRYYQRSLEHMRSGHYPSAARLVTKALVTADDAPEGVERTAVIGQVHLGAAISTARAGDGDESEEHLAHAQDAAERVGEVPSIYWLSFGPTNVTVHRVSALVERNQFDRAVKAASDVVMPNDWHATRRAHHFVDVGRAHAWLGRHDAALEMLTKARRIAPQRTRFHPVTRDTVEHLVETRRRLPQGLASYARWVGI
jgi:transcriptional regulator with XRE-family HTH domain